MSLTKQKIRKVDSIKGIILSWIRANGPLLSSEMYYTFVGNGTNKRHIQRAIRQLQDDGILRKQGNLDDMRGYHLELCNG